MPGPVGPGPVVATEVHRPADRVWVDSALLLWWTRGMRLPPLVTTSEAGTPLDRAGLLGSPGTRVLFGDDRVNDDLRAGGRVRAGAWLDDAQRTGLEAEFFMLESGGTAFGTGSGGSPILARPFANALANNSPASQLVAFPGVLGGAVNVGASSTGLLGAGAALRRSWCATPPCGCAPTAYRLDALLGYRYLRLADQLAINENLVNLSPVNNVPLGTAILVRDTFATRNEFHGADLGLTGEAQRGAWFVGATARVGLGWNVARLTVAGARTVTVPGFPTDVQAGGLLALPSNIGRSRRTDFTAVPEVGVRLGYQLSAGLRAYAGYNLLYWFDVVRAGDQVDLAVNPNLLPPGPAGAGPARPAVPFQETDFWAQGASLGLEWRY